MPSSFFDLLSASFRLLDDPPAPALFPSFFIFFFYVPTYLVLMAARSAFVDFTGWLQPRPARRLAESVNRIATLLFAGFLPGWLTTLAVYLWYPQWSDKEGLLAGFAAAVAYAIAYNLLLVRNVKGLPEALGRGFWHAVPLGGFFACLYMGIFLYSSEAVLAAFTFLFAPFGITAILPFASGAWLTSRTEPSATSCTLCAESVDGAPIRCAKCEASYHAECWDFSEGCARKPCRASAGPPLARG